MSAKDLYHDVVKQALKDEGWNVTADPLRIEFLGVELRIDLGAERVIAAERNGEKIAVEIKSFLRSSAITDFHEALGQYIDYREGLTHIEPERLLFLAVPIVAYQTFFQLPFGQYMIQRYQLKLLVYHPEEKVIVQWLP
jgi:XisH protein